MVSGVFPVSKAVIVDRELRCQGTSLLSWATDRGISPEMLEDALDGTRKGLEPFLLELAETLGISVGTLERTGT